MADSNILLLNQMYGIATVPVQNKNSDSNNKDAIGLSQGQFELSTPNGTGMNQVLLDEYQNTPNGNSASVPVASDAKFVGYLKQDYQTSTLEKKPGNYWITEQSKKIVLFTGTQFVQLGGGKDVESVNIKEYWFINSGDEANPVVEYPENLTYDILKQEINNKFIINLHFAGDIYQLGNIRQNSLQFSFNDQSDYKQIRLFNESSNYKTEYYRQSHSNYTQIV